MPQSSLIERPLVVCKNASCFANISLCQQPVRQHMMAICLCLKSVQQHLYVSSPASKRKLLVENKRHMDNLELFTQMIWIVVVTSSLTVPQTATFVVEPPNLPQSPLKFN